MSRYLYALSALVLLITLAGAGGAAAADQPPRGLVLFPVASLAEAERLEGAGLPIYARFSGAGDYVLAGGGSRELAALADAGLAGRLLDADTTGASYYLAYPGPGRTLPDWAAFGQLLFADERVAVLRIATADAERLAEAGAEIVHVSLVAKPLRPHAPAAFPPVTVADPIVQSMIAQVSTDTIYGYTADLSGVRPTIIRGAPYTITTRHTNSGTPITNATYYVGDHLASRGLTVEYHIWQAGKPPNVIGQLTGETTPANIFMITGHLDDMPSSGLAPGADDNASGSVAVLVAADILTQYRWGCTLRFALWTGEEQGLYGSAAYAQRAYNQSQNILGVLNLDMIAWNGVQYPAPDIDLHAKSTLPATVELANQFASIVNVYGINLIPQVITNGIGQSDHASFWTYNYTAILGIEDYYPNYHDFNPYYHTSNDRLEYLDMGYYTEFVKASVGSVAHMSNCLRTGTLAGTVTAAHNGSPIPAAQLSMTETHGLDYSATANATGSYNKTLPAAVYEVTATAPGYLPATVTGVNLAPDATVTQNFALTAMAATAPTAAIRVKGGQLLVIWRHVAPDTQYQAHRSTDPYFTPGPGTLRATYTMPFPNELSYSDDASGRGDPAVNHFYAVLGLNVAGQGAISNRVGEFDFALVPGG